LQFLGSFLQKPDRFIQKSSEIDRFLTILKKTASLSRNAEK